MPSTVAKSYVSKLETRLLREKEARTKMQREIEELKRINMEIVSKLEISSEQAHSATKKKPEEL